MTTSADEPAPNAPPGWYTVPDGSQWWDGVQWIGPIRPQPSSPSAPAVPRSRAIRRWIITMIVGAALVPVVLVLSLAPTDSLRLLASTLWLAIVITEVTSAIGLAVAALRH
jgi:hypothetical protein